jgi:dTDP-4-dehydrorhamnose reductase
MRLLVTGAAGMLGRDVAAAAESAGHDVTGLARRDLDITDPDAVRAAVAAARPDAVINCAAWTDVDGAEEHEADALRINGTGAGNVAAAAPYVVHVSSDYVFEGSATLPYREADATAPAGAYGRSKLAGEVLVAAAGEHAIVRSAWLFGIHGSNFVATMLRLGEDRDKVNVVADQFGCPTFTGHLAGALVDIAERRLSGILHVAGGGSCSWHELAQATFDEAGLDCRAAPVTTAEFPRPAPRPAWSVLGSTRPDAPVLPPWREGLSAYLRSEVLQ